MIDQPNAQTPGQFEVGDLIRNFNSVVRVVAIDPQGDLLVEIAPVKQNGVWQGGIGLRYHAAPDKCRKFAG